MSGKGVWLGRGKGREKWWDQLFSPYAYQNSIFPKRGENEKGKSVCWMKLLFPHPSDKFLSIYSFRFSVSILFYYYFWINFFHFFLFILLVLVLGFFLGAHLTFLSFLLLFLFVSSSLFFSLFLDPFVIFLFN